MSHELLIIDDDDRYSRLRLIGWWDQERLASARVLVVGAGALGNEVLKNLALVGIGTVLIVDFDEIEKSNLARSVLFRTSDCGRPKAEVAAESMREMNPDTNALAIHADILSGVGLGVFRDVDVVIGCLDNREARLWVNRQCWKVGTPWVDGGIQEINGVVKVFTPPDSACYECGMTEMDYRLINLRYSCPLLSREEMISGKVPTAPTISAVIGGLQAQEALKILHGFPVESGTACVFNGVTNQFYKTRFQRREDCLSHETYPTPLQFDDITTNDTAENLMQALRQRVEIVGTPRLTLNRDLVVSIDCHRCGISRSIMKTVDLVNHNEATCSECGDVTSCQCRKLELAWYYVSAL